MMSIQDGVTALNGSHSPQTLPLPLMSVTTVPSLHQRSSFLLSSSSIISSLAVTPSSAVTSPDSYGFDAPEKTLNGHNALAMVLLVLILMVIIVGTIVGNILVCVAVCLVRKLRRPYNYLLVSLAVSDLCVAILVMPMALLYELLGEWQFGRMACDVWVSFDVLSCTASILNLCMISVDRYLAITKPLEYGVKRTPKRMVAYILFVWIGAAFVSVPPVLILGNEHGDGSICQVCQNFWYQIYATFGSFYIPLTVMVTVYYKIFQAAKRIVDEEKKAQAHLKLVEEQGKSSQPFSKPSLNYTAKGKNAAASGNLTVPSRRCSVVQIINNGEVETKLAPLLPHLEEGSSKGDWIPNNPEKSFTHTNHLTRQQLPFSQVENNRFQRNSGGNQLLEVPVADSRHHGSISPVSTITTCESNWSLIPCRDDESGEVPASQVTQGGDSVQKKSSHNEGSEINSKTVPERTVRETNTKTSDTFHCKIEHENELDDRDDRCDAPCDVVHSTKDDDNPPDSDLGAPPLASEEGNNSLRGESFSFKHNSYTKIPSSEAPPVKKTNTGDDLSFKTLLGKSQPAGNAPERRKSSLGTNSPKKRFLHPPKSKLRLTLAKERKASTTLGIIMSAFIICWLPFFVLALVRPFLVDSAIPNTISSLFLWLGYANSLLNPIIYATLNKDFRKPFQEILCLRCSSLNILMREEFYYSQYGHDTPNHSHIRCSVPFKDTPEKGQLESFEEPMTESRF